MSDQYNIAHQSFGQASALADTLVIGFSRYDMSFCEIQSETNTILNVQSQLVDTALNQSMTEQLTLALNQLGFMKKTYRHVMVNVIDDVFTLCPVALYDEANARNLLEFNCGNTASKPLITNNINASVKLFFCMDEEVKSFFNRVFPHHHVKHQITILSHLFLTSEEFNNQQLLLSINENSINIIFKHQQQLVLANHYQAKTNEDVLYYLLFVMEQYQLDPASTTLSVIGNIAATDELLIQLKKYIKQVRLAVGHKAINWQLVTGMPQHFYFNLTNSIFCE